MNRAPTWAVSAMAGLAIVALLAAPIAAAKDKEKETDDEEGFVQFSKDHPLGEVSADKALVYVVRPTSMGSGVKSWLLCDDQPFGVNKGSSYFFAQVDRGRRVFWSKSENVDALELTVEAGRTYYLQQHVRMGGLKARTKLEVLDEATGQERLAKCAKHGVLTDAGRARGAEIAAEFKDRAAEDLARQDEKDPKEPDGKDE